MPSRRHRRRRRDGRDGRVVFFFFRLRRRRRRLVFVEDADEGLRRGIRGKLEDTRAIARFRSRDSVHERALDRAQVVEQRGDDGHHPGRRRLRELGVDGAPGGDVDRGVHVRGRAAEQKRGCRRRGSILGARRARPREPRGCRRGVLRDDDGRATGRRGETAGGGFDPRRGGKRLRLLDGEGAELPQRARPEPRVVLPGLAHDAQEQAQAHGALDGLVRPRRAPALQRVAQRDHAVEQGEERLDLARVLPRARGVEQDRVPQAPQRHLDERGVRGRLAQQVGQARARHGAVLLGVEGELALRGGTNEVREWSRGRALARDAARGGTHGEHLAEKPLGEVFHGEHGRGVARRRRGRPVRRFVPSGCGFPAGGKPCSPRPSDGKAFAKTGVRSWFQFGASLACLQTRPHGTLAKATRRVSRPTPFRAARTARRDG